MSISEGDLALAKQKKVTAALCGMLAGGFAVHKFLLGYTSAGLIQILASAVIFGTAIVLWWTDRISTSYVGLACIAAGVVGLIEGLIYLSKSDEDFFRIYIRGQRPWF